MRNRIRLTKAEDILGYGVLKGLCDCSRFASRHVRVVVEFRPEAPSKPHRYSDPYCMTVRRVEKIEEEVGKHKVYAPRRTARKGYCPEPNVERRDWTGLGSPDTGQ